jgi:tetratricopeptide (TPR) repeat protein
MSESDNDELESARILIQENLYDEAKRVLFRLLTRIHDPQSFNYRRTKEMLNKIESIEMNDLMNKNSRIKPDKNPEDTTSLITQLERDLQLQNFEDEVTSLDQEQWTVSEIPSTAQGLFDLAVAFYEMGCLGDALRELKRAEKKIRIEESFLGELGVSVVALQTQTLIKLGSAFKAKVYLEPVLMEPDLLHEQKIILYYSMGMVEQALEEKNTAKGWFQKVADFDPSFKDVQQRIKFLSKSS